jgi:signal transduction histidine kinase/HAMP domain-containing protein
MIVLVIIVVGLVAVNDYYNTKKMFERNSQHLDRQTEQDIIATVKLTDESYGLYDSSLNDQMRKGFDVVLIEYKRSGEIPAKMDLTSVKHELGDQYEIYVINESGVIEYTSFEPELGLDFKKVPDFFDYLTTIRNSEGFFPDRIVEDQQGSGQIRKFAYMPTPDHRYILELGFAKSSFSGERSAIQSKKTIERIASANPYIDRVRIFNIFGDLVENVSYDVDSPTRIMLEQVIQQRGDLTYEKSETDQTVKYLFIDLKNEQYGSDLSRIVEITYNDALFEKNANEHAQFHLEIAILALIFGGCVAFVLSRLLLKPINGIVRDVNRIADGDLDWKISPTHVTEFQVLEESINAMVLSMKTGLRDVQDEKTFRQELINNLPVAVFVKTVDDGKYIFWNTTSEKLFDRLAQDAIGKTSREIYSDEEATRIEADDRETVYGGMNIRHKKVHDSQYSGRFIHEIKLLITDSAGMPRYILGMAQDLTGETTGIKLDLLFSITRSDILDQLSIIMNSLERAQLKNTEDAMQAFFDNTLGSVESIRNQIEFFCSLQDHGLVSPKWQKVSRVFEDVTILLPVREIDIRSEVNDFEIYADPLLPRVFYNLIENSLRYGGHGLTTIRFSAEISADSLHIIYQDNGHGILPDKKLKIFEFRQGSVTGMNLFLVKEILGFTAITITENGEPAKGVRFEIVVPKNKFRHNR